MRSSHLHRFCIVPLFSAAICHITQAKVIIQDDSRLSPGQQLIIIPGEHAAGLLISLRRTVSLRPVVTFTEIIARFKRCTAPIIGNLTSLWYAESRGSTFMWENVLDVRRIGENIRRCNTGRFCMMARQDCCLLKWRYTLTEQVRQLIMLSPAAMTPVR